MKVYCNGKLEDKQNLEEVFEPGFLFGWGAFEAMRAYSGNIPFLDLHIERLNNGLALLGIDKVDLKWEDTIKGLLTENNLVDAYIRITAYKKRKETGVIIYVDKFGYYPPESYNKGFSALISPYKRNQHSVSCKVKSLSYLENRLSWFVAQKKNKSEALLLNQRGELVGGARSNLFLLREADAFTPSLEAGAFEGITRREVMAILNDLNIEVKEKKLTPDDIFNCEEVFLTSSLLEIMPLVELEDKTIAKGVPGELTKKIHSRYKELTRTS
ncbi:MAG: aminotransferase class IV [Candidatus Omnitrophota bacterium]|nr:MAG: aminotransferase class IV [Candidatus Omnitrophota bacterium]